MQQKQEVGLLPLPFVGGDKEENGCKMKGFNRRAATKAVKQRLIKKRDRDFLPNVPSLSIGFSLRSLQGPNLQERIEKFKKWHEGFYIEKLSQLMPEEEPLEKEEKAQVQHYRYTTHTHLHPIAYTERLDEQIIWEKSKAEVESPHPGPNIREIPPPSAGTWKTWRGVDDSYAYTNARSYISEQNLMPPEKEKRIQFWLDKVEENREFFQIYDPNDRPLDTEEEKDEIDEHDEIDKNSITYRALHNLL
ncbi:DgyrCDS8579 [Dimorphilus gyrociliatus]|uniref:DgyrCDS8579 n=1 Tax=Dimorphilus gyrociliatus TaxID=2664684 RepID=A0A7I8VVL2_9ANNE|nr:DgyrCDS8579 [Dimorphilus gyrociliatus]